MKIEDLILTLKNYPNQEEEIIVAWWEKDTVEEWMDRKISDKSWANAEDELMNSSWDDTDRTIRYAIENFKETEWSADDELNAQICEATDGMCSLSHTGG
jgi:hypothetical protein